MALTRCPEQFASIFIFWFKIFFFDIGPGEVFYWGERSEPCTSEVHANSVCMSSTDLYVCHRPTGRIAHAQKHAKHM